MNDIYYVEAVTLDFFSLLSGTISWRYWIHKDSVLQQELHVRLSWTMQSFNVLTYTEKTNQKSKSKIKVKKNKKQAIISDNVSGVMQESQEWSLENKTKIRFFKWN